MARKKGSKMFGPNVNVMVTQDMREMLEKESLRIGASVSTIVRMAVLSYFDNEIRSNVDGGTPRG